jgi:hypothetical protein
MVPKHRCCGHLIWGLPPSTMDQPHGNGSCPKWPVPPAVPVCGGGCRSCLAVLVLGVATCAPCRIQQIGSMDMRFRPGRADRWGVTGCEPAQTPSLPERWVLTPYPLDDPFRQRLDRRSVLGSTSCRSIFQQQPSLAPLLGASPMRRSPPRRLT